jgi:hypothetical protein
MTYGVLTKAGKEYDFGRLTLDAFSEFVRVLREVARQHSIQWEKSSERG